MERQLTRYPQRWFCEECSEVHPAPHRLNSFRADTGIVAASLTGGTTSWYYLLAWPGTTVTLLASLRNGQIIKCDMCPVRP